MVWLYNNAGKSVFAVAVFHATLNLAYMLFPENGSHFDMRLGGLVMAFAATIVTLVWGAQDLRSVQDCLIRCPDAPRLDVPPHEPPDLGHASTSCGSRAQDRQSCAVALQ